VSEGSRDGAAPLGIRGPAAGAGSVRAGAGRTLPLSGSAARGRVRHDSDVDILIDFPADRLSNAWSFAETTCWNLRLEPDIMSLDWCEQAFLDHISLELRMLE